MYSLNSKRRLRHKKTRCFAKRFSGEQRVLPQRFVRALRWVCKIRAAGKKVRGKSVGFSEERTPLGERARRASEPSRAKRATARKVSRLVYIEVRSEHIYQNLHNFSVRINKIELCEIAYLCTICFCCFFAKSVRLKNYKTRRNV